MLFKPVQNARIYSGIIIILAISLQVYCTPNKFTNGKYKNVQINDNEEQRFETCKSLQQYNLSDIAFNPYNVIEEDMACLCLQMFKEMDFIRHFNITTNTLFKFILRIQGGYRALPYHNWSHGFAVLHFSFVVLKQCQLIEKNYVTPLEGLALLTAGMSHDVDHPGTNNLFQLRFNTSLAQKYAAQGSILERHHINVSLGILKEPDTAFVAHLNIDEQSLFERSITNTILATDLPQHINNLLEIRAMAASGFDPANTRHHELLLSTIISCGDLSAQAHDWPSARRSAKQVYMEFFAQGDLEKQHGLVPSAIMDSSTADIPLQLRDFISQVVIPDFQVLQSLLPKTKPFMDNLQDNRQRWQRAIPYFHNQSSLGRDQMEVILDSTLDDEEYQGGAII